MAATYTTAAEVSLLLGALDGAGDRQVFDADSTPTITEVNSLIESKEEVINNITTRSWKSTTAVEYHNHRGYTYDQFGQRSNIARLVHKDITTLATGEGDKVEVWDGSDWTDIIAEEGAGAGENSFFVDYPSGVIHFYGASGIDWGYKTIKITYRYGISSVPLDISRVCALMVATQLLQTEGLLMTPEGDSSNYHLTKRDIIWQWTQEIKEVINRYKRFNWF